MSSIHTYKDKASEKFLDNSKKPDYSAKEFKLTDKVHNCKHEPQYKFPKYLRHNKKCILQKVVQEEPSLNQVPL